MTTIFQRKSCWGRRCVSEQQITYREFFLFALIYSANRSILQRKLLLFITLTWCAPRSPANHEFHCILFFAFPRKRYCLDVTITILKLSPFMKNFIQPHFNVGKCFSLLLPCRNISPELNVSFVSIKSYL